MKNILDKCRRREALTREEAYRLYDEAPLPLLARTADEVRRSVVPDPGVVTWQIDRNVNITNVCISGCRFCNFHCKPHQEERAYITTLDEYRTKIARTLELGGDQLLLQGGLHPKLDIGFYEQLFRDLKAICPTLKLHALGAPEVAHIARISGLSTCAASWPRGSTRCRARGPRFSIPRCGAPSRPPNPRSRSGCASCTRHTC